jgi:hypothetical protein
MLSRICVEDQPCGLRTTNRSPAAASLTECLMRQKPDVYTAIRWEL